jgi:multisubunit Na+/H+ antiporter MnhB subunit
MIIVGGLLYVISSGDPARQKRARETIQYAVVGVVIALISYAIVKFVIKVI